ncbi:MAG TPA: hypothetical protein VGQ12_12695 [Candidatus Angelobacter sp.]|nr:hypothetical protein [Candidatus Angelobacter sp.]
MIDIEDLLVFAGIVALLVVAFHIGLWTGIAGVGVLLIIGGLALGKLKSQRKHKGTN